MINRELIESKINLITEDLETLKQFENKSIEDMAKTDSLMLYAVERLLERVIGRAIDINQHIIVESDKITEKFPYTYKETFIALFKINVLEQGFAEEISKSATLRNYLVHEYDNLDKNILQKSIGLTITEYAKYLDQVKKYISN